MIIYAYSTKTFLEKQYFKIGHTDRDASKRIKEQDGTSNPEPLIKCAEWEVNNDLQDKDIHSGLIGRGYKKTRSDREWFHIDSTDPIRAIHEVVLHKNGGTSTITVSNSEWKQKYEETLILEKKQERERKLADAYEEIFKVYDYQKTFLTSLLHGEEKYGKPKNEREKIQVSMLKNKKYLDYQFSIVRTHEDNLATLESISTVITLANDHVDTALYYTKLHAVMDEILVSQKSIYNIRDSQREFCDKLYLQKLVSKYKSDKNKKSKTDAINFIINSLKHNQKCLDQELGDLKKLIHDYKQIDETFSITLTETENDILTSLECSNLEILRLENLKIDVKEKNLHNFFIKLCFGVFGLFLWVLLYVGLFGYINT